MAEETLVGPNVRLAQMLTRLLDEAGYPPRAVIWAFTSEFDSWRLWIVPATELGDKREFYLKLAGVFAAHEADLLGLDIGDVQFMPVDHPAIRGLRRFIRVEGISDARLANNVLNGYFLPDAIVIRLAV